MAAGPLFRQSITMHQAPFTIKVRAAKRRLTAKGLLRNIEWRVPSGTRDERGRQTVTTTMIDAFIEDRPGVDRTGARTTERDDDTVVLLLDPRAVFDTHTFRWGNPAHVYRIKGIVGVIQDIDTGTRYYSEITVIR